MLTFLVCLTALVIAYFTSGRYLERVAAIDPARSVPSETLFDGVDYVPMPRWRVFLIQLLNIAGTGPIFGAILGAAFGPVAFLWITLGGIFMGAMHDFLSGVMLVRNDGLSIPEAAGRYLGTGMRQFMRLFSVVLLVLVGAVFLLSPADILSGMVPSVPHTVWVWLILAYYFVATLLPIDKIIGKIYPIFGVALILMALALLGVLLFGPYRIPELTTLTNAQLDPHSVPIVPTLFITIACGAISGFHATQSPLMARCMRNERESRSVFYGAMISESIIALVWAAIAMAFWGDVAGLNGAIAEYGGQAAVMIDVIANKTLGPALAVFVIFGVVACAITSGDTAFRSARLIVADFMGVEQRTLRKRIYICIPLFALGLLIIFGLPFQTMWSYFAWMNQTLAAVTLWMIVAYLRHRGRAVWVGLIPALVMTYVCASYIFVSPLMLGMQNRTAAYLLGGGVTLAVLVAMIFKLKDNDAKGIS